MKVLLTLIGMVVAAILGYSLEPDFRFALTGKHPEKKEDKERKTVVIDAGDPTANQVNPAKFPQEFLPQKITLNADAKIRDLASDVTMMVPKGTKVDLLRVEGVQAIISTGSGAFEGSILVSDTNLRELLLFLKKNPEMMVSRNPKKEVEKEPEPEPEPEPTGPIDIVETMKESIKKGKLKTFKFDDVSEWVENDEEEEIDGESYKVGVVSYSSKTPFGVKTMTAKALFKDNRLVRWVHAKSGLEVQ